MTDQVNYLLSFTTVLGDVLVVLLVVALILRRFGVQIALFKDPLAMLAPHAVKFAFIVAAAGTIFSLYYSEIVGYAPCSLCWWQRIFLYPQVVILGVALFEKVRSSILPSIILSSIGLIFGLYSTFLQFGGSPFIPCAATGVLCSQRYFLEFGYVTIPTMSLTAFALVLVFLLVHRTAD